MAVSGIKLNLLPAYQSRSYRGLTPRTRIFIGAGVMAYAVFGLTLSDKAEEAFGLKATEKDKEDLREAVPKIHMVESEKK